MVGPPVVGAPPNADSVDREDVQGMVVRAYKRLPEARYLLAEIRNPVGARAWLGWLCDQRYGGRTPHGRSGRERRLHGIGAAPAWAGGSAAGHVLGRVPRRDDRGAPQPSARRPR